MLEHQPQPQMPDCKNFSLKNNVRDDTCLIWMDIWTMMGSMDIPAMMVVVVAESMMIASTKT